MFKGPYENILSSNLPKYICIIHIKEFNYYYHTQVWFVWLRDYRLPNKKISPQVVVRNVPEIPETTQPIAPAVGHLPEHDAKTLLQETPLTLFPAHGEKEVGND